MKKKWKDMEQTLRAAESAEPPAGQKERILARAAALPQEMCIRDRFTASLSMTASR